MQGLTTAKALVEVVVPVCVLGFAIFSAYWAGRQWRYQYITKEWWSLMQFLYAHAKYMRDEANENYKDNYKGVEQVQYQLVARLCIAYLDDVYHMRLQGFQKDWLVGTIACLAKPHREWLKDNKGAYSTEFYAFLTSSLNSQSLIADGK